jgi:hypothetical protein
MSYALVKSTQPVRERVWCGGIEKSDHPLPRLLRARRERPGGHRSAVEQRDERASLMGIALVSAFVATVPGLFATMTAT